MASADPANPAVMKMVSAAWGPSSSVTGASSTPGSIMKVFHMAFTPCGAFIAVVISAGRCPCAIAAASYRKNQASWSASLGLPVTVLVAGSRHSQIVTARAPSR